MFDVVVERARRDFAAQAINEHMVLATGTVTYLCDAVPYKILPDAFESIKQVATSRSKLFKGTRKYISTE